MSLVDILVIDRLTKGRLWKGELPLPFRRFAVGPDVAVGETCRDKLRGKNLYFGMPVWDRSDAVKQMLRDDVERVSGGREDGKEVRWTTEIVPG
ncbi:MAG: hypothetical protein Q9182_001224 [Xanthomendoza sp. 2 TL-2023]